MFVWKDNSKAVDASFIKDDEYVKKVGDLQQILYDLEEANFEESIYQINNLGSTSSSMALDLARNTHKILTSFMQKQSLFNRLLSRLMQQYSLETQTQVREHLHSSRIKYFLDIQSDSDFLNDFYSFRKMISNDNVEELKQAFISPDFDINQIQILNAWKLVEIPLYNFERMTLIEYAALYGSIACFRFLYINNAELNRKVEKYDGYYESYMINMAVAGGNVEIIQILEQAGIIPDESCFEFAIRFHRVEIFDWLVDQFPEFDFSILCFEYEFIHGINRIDKVDAEKALAISIERNISFLVRLLIPHVSVYDDETLSRACELGYTEIVKFLLTFPSINVNEPDVIFY